MAATATVLFSLLRQAVSPGSEAMRREMQGATAGSRAGARTYVPSASMGAVAVFRAPHAPIAPAGDGQAAAAGARSLARCPFAGL